MTLQGGKRKVAVIGKYRFTGKVLGKGNFARVEEAVHTVLNVKVAVKIMDVNVIKEDYVIKNLYREARILAQLNHPCIVALFQTMQQSDNVYYLVSELVGGGDLCSFIKCQRNGKLDERSTKVFARQFVSALAHMHSIGIVHRDLKMENVMLNSTQTQIKIVDFGLSNVWAPDYPLRTHCGSPEYAAPELFVTGRDYGPEVDLWSFGIILYGMMVGQLPFVSSRSDQMSSQERRKRLLAQINRGLATPQRRMIAAYSMDYRSLMGRLLIADSAKRITTAELVLHPWITDNGARTIRSHPLKNLDFETNIKIYRDIGILMEIHPDEVGMKILQEPFGTFGGMYNILVQECTTSMLLGSFGISKVMSGYSGLVQRPCTSPPKTTKIAWSTPRNEVVRKVYLKSTNPARNYANQTSSAAAKSRPGKVQPDREVRPKTSQSPKNAGKIITVTPKRQVYSATGVRPVIVQRVLTETKQVKGVGRPVTAKHVVRNGDAISNEVRVIGTRSVIAAMNFNKEPQKLKPKGILTMVNSSAQKNAAKSNKPHSKSEPITGLRRPISVPAAISEKSQACSRSVSRTASQTPGKTPSPAQTVTRRQVLMEGSSQGRGDNRFKRMISPRTNNTGSLTNGRKPVVYKPIAKSIADYFANNVPDELKQIKWPQIRQ